ncbi:hypothetical protein SpCBS45565_g08477 [Spizellomyces sp. 'palustris']|nr:hypothetical protein SpCBS45565_g08477 [Spizellomyces sp. 'palustris']
MVARLKLKGIDGRAPPGNNRSVMPLDVLGRTRATLMKAASNSPWPEGLGNLLKLHRAGDLSVSHQLALITSLPFYLMMQQPRATVNNTGMLTVTKSHGMAPLGLQYSHRWHNGNCVEPSHGIWEADAPNKARWSCREASHIVLPDGRCLCICSHSPSCYRPVVVNSWTDERFVNLPLHH